MVSYLLGNFTNNLLRITQYKYIYCFQRIYSSLTGDKKVAFSSIVMIGLHYGVNILAVNPQAAPIM